MSLGTRDSENFGCEKNRSCWKSVSLSSFGIAKLKNKIIPGVFNREGREEGGVSRNWGISPSSQTHA